MRVTEKRITDFFLYIVFFMYLKKQKNNICENKKAVKKIITKEEIV